MKDFPLAGRPTITSTSASCGAWLARGEARVGVIAIAREDERACESGVRLQSCEIAALRRRCRGARNWSNGGAVACALVAQCDTLYVCAVRANQALHISSRRGAAAASLTGSCSRALACRHLIWLHLPSMSSKKPVHVDVSPLELRFSNPNVQQERTLTLVNIAAQRVAFKVKTTAPKVRTRRGRCCMRLTRLGAVLNLLLRGFFFALGGRACALCAVACGCVGARARAWALGVDGGCLAALHDRASSAAVVSCIFRAALAACAIRGLLSKCLGRAGAERTCGL